jgi:hypothetical protein
MIALFNLCVQLVLQKPNLGVVDRASNEEALLSPGGRRNCFALHRDEEILLLGHTVGNHRRKTRLLRQHLVLTFVCILHLLIKHP